MNYEEIHQDELQNQNAPAQEFYLTQIFQRATTHYTVTNLLFLIYSILKVIVGLSVLYLIPNRIAECGYDDWIIYTQSSALTIWIFLIIIHSLVMIQVYQAQISFIGIDTNRNNIAFRLNHVRGVPEDDLDDSNLEETRGIGICARQIKSEVQKSVLCGKIGNRFNFLLFQCLFGYGLVLFFTLYRTQVQCQQYQFYFLSSIIVLAIYQYIDFYIILVFALLCSPFLIIFGIYYLISMCTKHQQQQEMIQALNPINYQPSLIQGDQQCSICYSAYELGDKVIILKCSPLHHFHDECILAWLNVQSTCPLCRSHI